MKSILLDICEVSCTQESRFARQKISSMYLPVSHLSPSQPASHRQTKSFEELSPASFESLSFECESFDFESLDFESFDFESFDFEPFDFESFDFESFESDPSPDAPDEPSSFTHMPCSPQGSDSQGSDHVVVVGAAVVVVTGSVSEAAIVKVVTGSVPGADVVVVVAGSVSGAVVVVIVAGSVSGATVVVVAAGSVSGAAVVVVVVAVEAIFSKFSRPNESVVDLSDVGVAGSLPLTA